MKEFLRFGIELFTIIVLMLLGGVAIAIDLNELGTIERMLVVILRILIIFPAALWYAENIKFK